MAREPCTPFLLLCCSQMMQEVRCSTILQKEKSLEQNKKANITMNYPIIIYQSTRQLQDNGRRIVRVSKAFGGKDRKVCTVKGLRDRRIRLSAPTAIQLYDLQGLNQPSKVIDWLIDSTKDDIDKLPPLQMLPSDFNFNQFHPLPTTIPHQDLNHDPQISLSQFLTSPNNASFVKDVGNRTLLYTKQGLKLDSDHDHINGDHQRMKGKEAIVDDEQENGNGNGGLPYTSIFLSSRNVSIL